MKKIEDIKVSIIVAIYKSAPFLEKLIESIISQTHKNIEIILVEDGSPDESGMICDKYAEQDSRIIVLHQENQGACSARNNGMRIMTGEYFSIIDGDDWLEIDYVEYLLQLIVEKNAEMAYTDAIFTTRDRIQVSCDYREIWDHDRTVEELLMYIPIGPWNKLYNTNMIRSHNLTFSVPWSGEGMYFTVMAAQYANQIAKGHRKIYNYRLNNAGSGLTNYNVQMGLNGLWNIKNLARVSPRKSKIITYAIEWRTWTNYAYVLKLIVATHSYRKYWKEFVISRFNILYLFPSIVCHHQYSKKQIFSMFKHVLLPMYYARKAIAQERQALLEDTMV